MGKLRAHVLVSGQVQGVMFRETTRREADRRRVAGWVRNLSDGRVEAVFEGEEEDVRGLVQWCHRGPSRASVEAVDVDWEPVQGDLESFEIGHGWEW